MLSELYQEVILDHGKKPRNFGTVDGATHCAEGFNTLCGDKVIVSLNLTDNRISEIKFTGAGCAICMASASLMTQMIKGSTIPDVDDLFEKFQIAVTSDEANLEGLGELEALVGVRQYPNRVKCATLAWHAVREAIRNGSQEVNA